MSMSARLSLKDQLAQLDQPAPIDLDPEDVLAGADPFEHRLSVHRPAAIEHYIDVAPSSLRKLHESANDPKYHAVHTSRKQLYEASDDELEDKDSEEGDDDDEHETLNEEDEQVSESERGTEGPASPAQKQAANEGHSKRLVPPGQAPEDLHAQSDIASNLRQTHEADKKKGTAVSRQIALWDTLLDARIQLQKAVTAANCLPLPGESERYGANPSAREALNSLLEAGGSLTEELFSLQEDLLRLNEQMEAPPRKRRRVGTAVGTAGEYESLLREQSGFASALEESYHAWAVETLSKWSAKVQAVAPNVLLPDNRGSFMRDGKAPQVGVVGLIEEVLRDEGTKLLDRTRKRKDMAVRIGERGRSGSDGTGEELEVFDDTEYYQQLLRDVIGARGEGEESWQMAQRERKARRKKEVDTRASKGRKVRYEVHGKLQNFMVPVRWVAGGDGDWHDEQIDGLFSSLVQ